MGAGHCPLPPTTGPTPPGQRGPCTLPLSLLQALEALKQQQAGSGPWEPSFVGPPSQQASQEPPLSASPPSFHCSGGGERQVPPGTMSTEAEVPPAGPDLVTTGDKMQAHVSAPHRSMSGLS